MQGKTINGYTLQHLLGMGGMAEVWYAENAIGKKAAVKLLLPKYCSDEAIVARFENEAKVMVHLDHPNIRQVYDYGSIEGRPCIVMEYLEGDDLKAMMKQGKRFTDAELRKWWDQIADALNYTHAKGVVHRDIKPSNIFLDKKGNIKLLDFGIAKIRESISMTQTGAMMGTLMYMSPEQVRDSKHIGPESDVYSLAVSFVHMITGKKPYDSDTTSDYDIRKGIVEIPLDLTGVPADWQGFLAPYLEKVPKKRPVLRHFEMVSMSREPEMPVEKNELIEKQSNSKPVKEVEDEGTVVEGAGKPELTPIEKPIEKQPVPEKQEKNKSKKGLWIGLGVAAAAIVAVLLWPKDPYKEIDQWLNESECIYDTCLDETMVDYFLDIVQLNIGFDYCFRASQALSSMENRVPEEWMPRMIRCDSLDADYVNKISAFVENELNNLSLEQDTAAIISRLRQLEEFSYIRMNMDDNGMLERIEKVIGLWRNPTGSDNGHEWVYLGLPSGTLWATCNLGASSCSGYGNHYAWGETTTKSYYTVANYKYATGTYWEDARLTKYCNMSVYGKNGFTDDWTELQYIDDPATAWGSGWHTPSKAQWDELLENTTQQWTTQNGVKGCLFTAKNGKAIFLPAAGRFYRELELIGISCDYWSRSLSRNDPRSAWSLRFMGDWLDHQDYYDLGSYYRESGHSIRPVCER
ncbi:MAG: protein kinase [Bacteroidales bacterium]|nr:protein kinase [Bacteroidales bacterium]